MSQDLYRVVLSANLVESIFEHLLVDWLGAKCYFLCQLISNSKLDFWILLLTWQFFYLDLSSISIFRLAITKLHALEFTFYFMHKL